MEPQKVTLTVSLAGIIELFGNRLYKDFGAIVRELVQNGHDACLEDYTDGNSANKNWHLSDYWVNVRFDNFGRKLIIADCGTGMGMGDVSKNLNDFAKPRKAEKRDAVLLASGEDPLYIIGIYGIGFMSALSVSSKVEVWSRREGHNPICWTYQCENDYAHVMEVANDEIEALKSKHGLSKASPASGTIVICHLADDIEEQFIVDTQSVRDSLLQYTRLLRIAVHFNGELINDTSAAWKNPAHATPEDWKEMISKCTGANPLLTIPIYSPPSELDIEGVLWIPPRKKILGDNGFIDIYIRRMFVLQDMSILRPSWAVFIMGMINCNKLDRVISGSDVIRDNQLELIARFVEQQILNAFQRLRELPENEYWKVIGEYDDIVKLSAADHSVFLDFVWDKLRVKTGAGRITIPEYLAQVELKSNHKDVGYYYDKSIQEFSAALVSDATSIPVLSLCTLNDSGFVRQVFKHKGYSLLLYTEMASTVIKKPQRESDYQSLIAACAASNIAADIREFEPHHIPAMLIEDHDLEDRRREWLAYLLEGDRVDHKLAKEIQNTFLRGGLLNREVSFYLNAANPLIKELVRNSFETQQAVCKALYNLSYMSIMPQLDRDEIRGVYDSISSLLMNLLEGKIQDGPVDPEKCRPIRLFMITPFSDKYKAVEKAVRSFFEGPPYFFKIVLARDFSHESQLLDDIRAHIDAADGFIAEITELNPNVMLELGAVLIKKDKNKPVFILRGPATVEDKVPSDIQSELYISYNSPDNSDGIANSIRSRLESNGVMTHSHIISLMEKRTCKALSKTLLVNSRCNEDEQARILKSYKTVEELLADDPKDVSNNTGVPLHLIKFLVEEIKSFEKPLLI